MRTTMIAFGRAGVSEGSLPRHRDSQSNDLATVAALKTLQSEFPFLELLEVPPTDHPSWQPVWDAWNSQPQGLLVASGPERLQQGPAAQEDAAAGLCLLQLDDDQSRRRHVDELHRRQLLPAEGSFPGRRHRQPQVQGHAGQERRGQCRPDLAVDILRLRSHGVGRLASTSTCPAIPSSRTGCWARASSSTPRTSTTSAASIPGSPSRIRRVGLRLWKNGKNLGIMEGSLIEEVPTTFANAILQRKRWIAGFFQTLKFRDGPMDRMGFSFIEKIKAWLIFLPCLTMSFNCFGLAAVSVGGRDMVQRHWPSCPIGASTGPLRTWPFTPSS